MQPIPNGNPPFPFVYASTGSFGYGKNVSCTMIALSSATPKRFLFRSRR